MIFILLIRHVLKLYVLTFQIRTWRQRRERFGHVIWIMNFRRWVWTLPLELIPGIYLHLVDITRKTLTFLTPVYVLHASDWLGGKALGFIPRIMRISSRRVAIQIRPRRVSILDCGRQIDLVICAWAPRRRRRWAHVTNDTLWWPRTWIIVEAEKWVCIWIALPHGR